MKEKFEVQSFYDRFVNRTDVWAKQYCSANSFGYQYITPDKDDYSPLTLATIEKHLSGSLTLSLPTISADGMSKWCVWDSDQEDESIDSIFQYLKNLKLHPSREAKRPGRDGHLWLFFDTPISAANLLLFNSLVKNATKYSDCVEFFPKSVNKLSQMRLPLGVHRKPEARRIIGWFEEAPKEISTQLKWLSIQGKDSSERICRLAAYWKEFQKPQQNNIRFKRLPVNNKEELNLMDIVQPQKRVGKDYAAPCPLCRIEGNDRHGDNLRLSSDGLRINCVFGGPNQVHKTVDIYNYYRAAIN